MSKFLLLECNRLRSKGGNLLDNTKDEFKNNWINNISSSGIVINAGDQISLEETIVNSRGASDEVIEFRGAENENGFLDNKVELTYSFYINNSGINTVKLPLINHCTYRGNAATIAGASDTTLTPELTAPPAASTFSDQTNGQVLAHSNQNYLYVYAKRSIGETFFYPDDGSAATTYTTQPYDGMTDSSIVFGNYLFRIREKVKGGSAANNINDGYKAGFIYNTVISPAANPAGTPFSGSGMKIKVISTTSTGNIYGIIDKFEVFDIGSGYNPDALISGLATIKLMEPISGDPFQGTSHEFELTSFPSENFKETNTKDFFDGKRYYFNNIDFGGFCDSREYTDNTADTPAQDLTKFNSTYGKRTRSLSLEVPVGFATPDNVGEILTDQLHKPSKITKENDTAPFLKYSKMVNAHSTETGDISFDFEPVVIDTPTYSPVCMNGSQSGNPRGDLNTFTQVRNRFYNSVAWLEPERIEGLNYFNTGYRKATTDHGDIDILTGRLDTPSTQTSGLGTVGDFGYGHTREFGNHVVLLNTFKNTDFQNNADKGVSNQVGLTKGSLIITNLKYTENNIKGLAAGFKKAEKYIGDLSQNIDVDSQAFKNRLGVFLDIGAYDDEFSNKVLVRDTQGNTLKGQRLKFATITESANFGNVEIPVDHNFADPTTGRTLQGYQKDFFNLDNDGQKLGGVWIKSRFQNGYLYNPSSVDGTTPNPNGDTANFRGTFQAETFTPDTSVFNFSTAGDITFESFFNSRFTNENGITQNYEEYIKLSQENDIGAIPVFCRHEGVNTMTRGGIDLVLETPFIAFVSAFELGTPTQPFDPQLGTDSANNIWRLDTSNSTFGTKIGLDKSFTRNEAVFMYNPQINNVLSASLAGGTADGNNYINYGYIGAVNPSIIFNPALSRFEISGLNTPVSTGNGLLTDILNNFEANDNPNQQVLNLNRKGQIITKQSKPRGDQVNGADGNPIPISITRISNFQVRQKEGSILDSQSGISIEGLGLYDKSGNITQLTETDFTKFQFSLFDKIGFDLNQLLPRIGESNAFFTNDFLFQTHTGFKYQDIPNFFTKPTTTGSYVSSAEIQTLSLNEDDAPVFNLGMDSLRDSSPDISQGAISAFKLPTKLEIPYFLVYSSILEGGVDTQFIGGEDGQSKIPAIGILTRENNQGDFFYSPSSDFVFTATKDFVITEIETSIRLPDGSRPKLESHSSIIYKITKPLRSLPQNATPIPQHVKRTEENRRNKKGN